MCIVKCHYKVAQNISLCISCDFKEHNGRSFNEKVNIFFHIFADRLYSQVTFRMLLCARKPSISLTAVSLLIKHDYSVIELYNVIFRKAVVFSAWRDLIIETNLNGIGANAKGLHLPHTLTLRTGIVKPRPQISIKQHVLCWFNRRLISLKTSCQNQYVLTKRSLHKAYVWFKRPCFASYHNSRERNVVFRTSVEMVSFNALSSENNHRTSVICKT